MLYLLESEDFCMLLEEEKEVLEETPAESEPVEEETKVEEPKEEKPQLPENVFSPFLIMSKDETTRLEEITGKPFAIASNVV